MERRKVLEALDTAPEGLAQEHADGQAGDATAGGRYDEVGLGKATLDELANPLTPVLAAGAGVSAASGSVTDAVLIGGVAAVNALLGGLQRVGATRAHGSTVPGQRDPGPGAARRP